MAQITATNGTKITVDNEDVTLLCGYSWYIDGHSYAYTLLGSSVLFMHRLLCPSGDVVDHVDQNPLNNSRGNLRPATRSQNAANRGVTKRSKTGYKGVFYCKKSKWFKAMIRVDYTLYYLGMFKTAEEAAVAYNVAAIEYFKEFATLNILTTDTGG